VYSFGKLLVACYVRMKQYSIEFQGFIWAVHHKIIEQQATDFRPNFFDGRFSSKLAVHHKEV
jgi:hypothetical protein